MHGRQNSENKMAQPEQEILKKPIIGINCDLDMTGEGRVYKRPYLFIYTNYFDAIVRAGGIPVLLPCVEAKNDVRQQLSCIDGLMLTGCLHDIDPGVYGCPDHDASAIMPERRQDFDLSLAKFLLRMKDLPILAICSGMQLVNVAAGGTLIQEICNEYSSTIDYFQMDRAEQIVHEVDIQPNSRLARISGRAVLGVNSVHHQAIDKIAPGFHEAARSPDGVVEAIETAGDHYVIGIQWHPERLTHEDLHMHLFHNFIEQANINKGRGVETARSSSSEGKT